MEQDFLRDQAYQLRVEAEDEQDISIKIEFLDLAMVCEEVANDLDDRLTSG